MKKYFIMILMLAFLLTVGGCRKVKDKVIDDEIDENPLKDVDVGGINCLSIQEESDKIILENEKIRVIFSKNDGSIVEICNKESKVYLTKNASAKPFRVTKITNHQEILINNTPSFNYVILNDDDLRKDLKFSWSVSGLNINSVISLTKESNEVTFKLSYENNVCNTASNIVKDSLYNIEYPIIDDIDTLYKKENDYYVSSYATGYSFNNPVDNFNLSTFNGISKSIGMYPSGWNTSMQMQYYYSLGIGGFMFMTKDSGNTIKSFTCTGNNNKLRMSIYHYLDDLSVVNGEFNYDISISNLIQGNWYEGAEKYRDWAKEQPWCTEKEQLKYREDNINKDFYEDTILCNFNFPYQGKYKTNNQKTLYELEKNSLNGGKILNVAFGTKEAYNDQLLQLAKNNKDLFVFFEFPDFYLTDDANKNMSAWNSMIKNYNSSQPFYYYIGSSQYFYECVGYNEYRNRFLNKQRDYYTKYKVDGYYHDVGIAAVHPMQCFNLEHDHGTNVNLIQSSLDQMEEVKNLAVAQNNGIYGQELVFEQMLPYLDFYQARANGNQLSGMEHDRIMALLDNNSARKIPLFDYVYSSYGAKRIDGFLLPDTSIGKGYYYVTEYTVINGGIVEYNYEFFENIEYITVDECDQDRMNYLGYLYDLKKSFNNFLVYGEMVKAPSIDSSKTTYPYRLIRFDAREGEATFDDIITSAYEYEDEIAIFVANTSSKKMNVSFVLNALKNYGIKNGTVSVMDLNKTVETINLNNGKANIDLNIDAHKIFVLKIKK